MISGNKVNASPTKEFFVEMLIRDILLKEAIIELIDNSIDGARRTGQNKNCSKIFMNFNKDIFEIEDNCGGIPLNIAREKAFRFGKSKNNKIHEENTVETTGIFGIGMKRSLFKIGEYFEIVSTTLQSKFVLKVDVSEWLRNETDWDFTLETYDEDIHTEEEVGTKIIIKKLRDEVSREFNNDDFYRELVKHVERRLGGEISEGVEISINDKHLAAQNVTLIDSEEISPIKKEVTYNFVKVKIIAGIAPPDDEEKQRYFPEKAGWYIYCNSRLVVAADKTSLTTWRDIDNANTGIAFHNNYAMFRGCVYFNSTYPEKLPWNTTKTNIDKNASVYLMAREEMKEIFKIVKGFIDDIRRDRGEVLDLEEDIAFSKSIASRVTNLGRKELSTKHVVDSISNNLELSTVKMKPVKEEEKLVTITYQKPKVDVDLLRETLNVKSNKDVGIKTFEYYKDAEC